MVALRVELLAAREHGHELLDAPRARLRALGVADPVEHRVAVLAVERLEELAGLRLGVECRLEVVGNRGVALALVRGVWSYLLPTSGILAQSALFEVIEGVVATVVSPELGTAYLGTQGDEWDAQKDMAAALAGALLTMVVTCLGSRGRASS